MQSIKSRNNECMLPTSSNSSTSSINSSTGPAPGKLMAISSIIAAPMFSSSSSKLYHKEAMERRASAPSHPYHHPLRYPSLFRSPPTSPEEKLFESSTPSSPSSFVYILLMQLYFLGDAPEVLMVVEKGLGHLTTRHPHLHPS